MGEWKEIEDHTADAGIEVRSNHIADLFITAAIAFTELSTNPSTLEVANIDRIRIECATDELDIMLREMLARFLYELDVNDRLPIRVTSIGFSDNVVTLECIWGNWIDGKSESKMEIKAVTYHMLEVTQVEEGWYGKVLFDI
jgi:SHS2 domain-containing protein